MSGNQTDRPWEHDETAEAKAKEDAKINRGAWAMVIAFVLLVGGCVALTSRDGQSSGSNHTAAWMNCKAAVTGQLNNPATADFAITNTAMTDTAAGGVHIVGSLTAENAFGVKQEIRFTCDATSSGSITGVNVS